jgi:hypothetical protein
VDFKAIRNQFYKQFTKFHPSLMEVISTENALAYQGLYHKTCYDHNLRISVIS